MEAGEFKDLTLQPSLKPEASCVIGTSCSSTTLQSHALRYADLQLLHCWYGLNSAATSHLHPSHDDAAQAVTAHACLLSLTILDMLCILRFPRHAVCYLRPLCCRYFRQKLFVLLLLEACVASLPMAPCTYPCLTCFFRIDETQLGTPGYQVPNLGRAPPQGILHDLHKKASQPQYKNEAKETLFLWMELLDLADPDQTCKHDVWKKGARLVAHADRKWRRSNLGPCLLPFTYDLLLL